MHEQANKIKVLIIAYLKGDIDDHGIAELERWKSESVENRKLYDRITSSRIVKDIEHNAVQRREMFKIIEDRIEAGERATQTARVRTMRRRWMVAASAILVIAVGSYVVFINKPTGQSKDTAKTAVNIKTIDVKTGRGQVHQQVLPDGSKVWLNAETKLTYPETFEGQKERVVELTGEAYVEVTPNKEIPFRLIAHGTVVKVLGTRFNISAYHDDKYIRTSLLEGNVEVTNEDGKTKKLFPGQQALINKTDSSFLVREAKVDSSRLWISESFYFDSDDLETVLRQLSRWYDVEVEYASKPNTGPFTGPIKKNIPLEKLLKYLEFTTRVKLELKDNKIIVSQ